MSLSPRSRKYINTIAIISLIGIIVGPLFANLVYGYTLYRLIKGITIGFLITSISSSAELFFFQHKLRRINFSFALLIRTFFYIAVISFSLILVVVLHEASEDGTDIITTLFSPDMHDFFTNDYITILLFSIVASFIINFLWQINRMLGRGVLFNLLVGRYGSPVAENKIFMFLDLKSSTTIAEQLGTNKYSSFIQDLFYDVTEPIIETKGEIYQYIGDEIVLTWRIKNGINNNNCLWCFDKIREKIKAKEPEYFSKYGIIPVFKAGLHCGEAIVTEVGDIKKEIVYHGDVLNTASRIQEQCSLLNKDFLISDELLNLLNIENYHIESMGIFKLRGKEKEIKLYNLVPNHYYLST